MLNEPVPVYHEQAERLIIGACFQWPSWVGYITRRLQPAHIWQPSHRLLFSAIHRLNAAGIDANPITIEDELIAAGELEDAGGERNAWEIQNWFVQQVVSEATIPSACTRIMECWARREIQSIASTSSEDPMDQILERLDGLKGQIIMNNGARSGPISRFVNRDRCKSGCASGFSLVDRHTITGGWPEGQMSVVSAYTGSGKSALMLQSALAIARRGGRICFGTWADLDGFDLADRLIKQICGFSFRPADPTGAKAYDLAADEVEALGNRIEVYDATSLRHGRDLEVFRIELLRKHDKTPFQCCFLDYAQKIEIRDVARMSDVERANRTSEAVRWLAADSHLPIVIGSQITEGSDKQGTREITKGSRAWEEDAGLLLRVKVYADDERKKLNIDEHYKCVRGLAKIELAKNRFGKRALTDFMAFDPRTVKFTEL